MVVVALCTTAAYLLAVGLCRRRRLELAMALVVQAAAVAALVWGRVRADEFLIPALAGWTLLGVLHIAGRPGVLGRAAPLALLVLLSCSYDASEALRWTARLHMAGLVAVLLTLGWVWPHTRYRALGAAAGSAWLLVVVGRSALVGRHPAATFAVGAAFLLLVTAALVSWHKRRLLEWLHAEASPR
jgi:hypothetical protein